MQKKKIPRDAILSAMQNVLELGLFTEEIFFRQMNDDELDKEINSARKELNEKKIINKENSEHVLMGILMKKLRGRISAPKVANKIGFKKGGKK